MRKLLLLSCLFVSQVLIAGESLWTDISPDYQLKSTQSINNSSAIARQLTLDYDALTEQLAAPIASQLEFPLPNGEILLLQVETNTVMSPALAAKFPNIKTWRVYDPENMKVSGSIDIGPNGFHGFIHTADGNRVFIDPDSNEDNSLYTVISQRDNTKGNNTPFQCQLHDHSNTFSLRPSFTPIETNARSIGTTAPPLITYRLAIAATGEYTQVYVWHKSKCNGRHHYHHQ